jgi:hypothetical protein
MSRASFEAKPAFMLRDGKTGRNSTMMHGPPFAILSALLFGASTPFAKLLLGDGANP